MGFEEITHTADWALRVWADDLEGLFAEAARGMYALSGSLFTPAFPAVSHQCAAVARGTNGGGQARVAQAQGAVKPGSEAERQADGLKVKRTFEAEAPDAESLLVAFLSELVYAAEQEHLMFDEFDIQFEGVKMQVEMSGAPILSLTKAIKAVTYHNLQIQQSARGYEVEIVFDV